MLDFYEVSSSTKKAILASVTEEEVPEDLAEALEAYEVAKAQKAKAEKDLVDKWA